MRHFCKVPTYFILAQDSEVTLELVDEGKEHIKREKRRRQRLAESVSRRRDFANRYGDLESNSRGKLFPILSLDSERTLPCKRSMYVRFLFITQLTRKFCTNHLFATNHWKKLPESCLVANTYFYRFFLFTFFCNNNVIFVYCIFVGIILGSFFSEARQRANEIVKSSRPVSSPERSLLAETPLHHGGGPEDQGSIYTETIDLSSPINSNFRVAEPPRNIFDDI